MALREATCMLWILNVLIAALLSIFFGWTTSMIWVAIGWAILLALCIPMAIAEAFNASRETRLRSRIGDLMMLIGFLGLFWLSVVAFPIAFTGMHLYEGARLAAIRTGYPKA